MPDISAWFRSYFYRSRHLVPYVCLGLQVLRRHWYWIRGRLDRVSIARAVPVLNCSDDWSSRHRHCDYHTWILKKSPDALNLLVPILAQSVRRILKWPRACSDATVPFRFPIQTTVSFRFENLKTERAFGAT